MSPRERSRKAKVAEVQPGGVAPEPGPGLAGARARPPDAGASPPGSGGGEGPDDGVADAVLADADVLEGELAARLQGLPPASDVRFTTWRPGSGAPPRFEPVLPPVPEPRQEDFTLVSELGAGFSALGSPPTSPATRGSGAAAQDPLADFFYRPDEEAPAVPDLGSPAAPAAERAPEPAVREEYLTFLLGGEEYALAIERVREVMKPPPITEVPRAPAHVLGVVTVRGEVVAVFDPRRRLGLPGAPPGEGQGRIVIVDAGEGPCGLLVDAVASVVRLRPGSIEPCPQGIGGASAECLAGIGREADRLFTVLDLGAFLRRPPGAPRRAEGEGGNAGT